MKKGPETRVSGPGSSIYRMQAYQKYMLAHEYVPAVTAK